jgi:hypothetical protein
MEEEKRATLFGYTGLFECRCDKSLKTKVEESTRHLHSVAGVEHLKTKTRLVDEKFVSVMGECVI